MNRKTFLAIKLILLIVLFFTLVGGCIYVLSINKGMQRGDYHMNTVVSTANARTHTFSNVSNIVVEAISLPIEVVEADVNQVTVIDNSRSYGLTAGGNNTVSQDGQTILFKQGRRVSFLGFTRGNVIIQVPRGVVCSYTLSSISGSIYHNAPSTGTLSLDSTSGSIKVSQGGDTLIANTISGSIKVYDAFTSVRAYSTSGSIKARANQDTTSIVSSSVSGSIKVSLDNVSGYQLIHSSASGSVKDEYSRNEYSKSGTSTYGDGSLMIEARTTSGSIKLTDW